MVSGCFGLVLVAIVLISTGCLTAEAAAPQPDSVFFLADDLGYGDLACYGAKDIPTQNLDRLAAQGERFIDFADRRASNRR